MADWRLSRGQYLGIWLVLVGLQLAPFALGIGPSELSGRIAWVVAFQLLKVVPAVGRMTDLGRAPDDALFATLIPIANIYVFFAILLGRTPSDKRRQKLLARWQGQPSWYAAAVPALNAMARSAGPGLLGVLFLAVPQVLILDWVEQAVPTWTTWSPETLAQASQAGMVATAFLFLYTALQLFKRKTATPASWIPAIFFVPSAWITGALLAIGSQSYGQLVPLHVGLVSTGVIFVWHSVVGAAVAVLWVLAADAAHNGQPASLSELAEGMRAKLLTVMPAHAGRVQLVWIGGQVIVPGLFYWVYAAFVVQAGVLEDPPSHPLTTRSGQLTWGMMSRLVKLAVVYALLILATQLVVVALHGPAVAQSVLMMDASAVPLETQLVVEILGTFALWWVTVVLTLLYRGRVAQLVERRRKREEAKAAAEAVA